MSLALSIVTISLFPEMFAALDYGVVGRAQKKNILNLQAINPRSFVPTNYHRVDDRPYGGGPGMVMLYEPLAQSIAKAKQMLSESATVIYLSPQGRVLDQSQVSYLAAKKELILLAGRYEGVDERLIEQEVDEEYSIGDYITSGGELPAMVLLDAVARLLPGVLGHEDSAQQDSFVQGLLDYPHYTRPEIINQHRVPDVLLSGDHAKILRWRIKQSLGRTWQRRPDLIKRRFLNNLEKKLLDEFKEEN